MPGIPEEYRAAIKRGKPPDTMLGKLGIADVKSIVEDANGVLTVDFIITTGVLDRDQDTINPDGWDFAQFEKNPVVLWAHDTRRPPVARSKRIWRDGQSWKSTAEFVPRELSAFGYSIGQMYKSGFLNAVSVGFRAMEARASPDESRPWGVDFLKQELWEYSCCPVPANPEALVDGKGIDTKPLLEFVEESLDLAEFIPKETAEKLYKVLSAKTIVNLPQMRMPARGVVSHTNKLAEIDGRLKQLQGGKS